VGLAAVQICRRAGVEIFATAGNDEKRAYLRSLGIRHVMDSRSLDFAQQTMSATSGKGVDVLLNSLAGPFIDAGLSVMARGGRFVEIGKTDLRKPEDVRRQFPGVEYTSIYLTNQLLRDPDFMRSRLQATVDRIASGDLDFLPHQSFPLKDAPDAFRRMALARHIGKIVLTCSISETDRQFIRNDRSYVVTGGLGGVGFEVAKWLAAEGAGELVLAGRRDPSSEVLSAIAELRAQGKSVSVVNADVAAPQGAESILSAVSRPLSGIFHCAGVYDDSPIAALNEQRFERVMRPKLDGAMNLHRLTAGTNLDLFVCFSSLASVGGSPGQANYGAANAFLDALAHYRRSLGLPSLTVNWGAWDRAGRATSENVRKRLAEMGAKLMPPANALRAFEIALQEDSGAQIAIAPIHWPRFFSAHASRRAASVYAEFQQIAASDPAPRQNPDFVAALAQEPPARRSAKLVARLQEMAANVLGLGSPALIDPEQPLHDFGMDSLIAVELRNSVSAAIGRTLPATILFDYPTVATLAAHLERILFAAECEAEPSAKSESASVLDMIELMSDEEVDRLLSRNVGGGPG
jgi:NADPH:quinone reductase-like Zn-dependent oxidoreductase/acyl carrier protein